MSRRASRVAASLDSATPRPAHLELRSSIVSDIAEADAKATASELVVAGTVHAVKQGMDGVGLSYAAKALGSLAATLDQRWHKLFCDSKTKDLRLGKVKEQFREVTKTQAVEFQDEIKALETEFYKSGPGSSGLTLDDGVEIVKEYKRMIAKCNKRKAELVNAENLFNLEMTTYPVLTEMSVELDKLFTIYNFYSDFKEFQARVPPPLLC